MNRRELVQRIAAVATVPSFASVVRFVPDNPAQGTVEYYGTPTITLAEARQRVYNELSDAGYAMPARPEKPDYAVAGGNQYVLKVMREHRLEELRIYRDLVTQVDRLARSIMEIT